LTAKVRRVVSRVAGVSGLRDQVGGVSGCPHRGVVRQWVWLRAAGSGGKCVRLRKAGGQAGGASDCGKRGSGRRCVGLWTAGVRRVVRRVAGVSGRCGQVGGALG
jgi:hypothetical protein